MSRFHTGIALKFRAQRLAIVVPCHRVRITAFVAAVAACALSAQTPVFRVPVRVVEAPAVVTASDGSPVRTLRPEEFRLFDNDRLQEFRLGYAERPLSLAIVVQISDGVRAWLPEVRKTKSAIESLLIGENGDASLIAFSDDVRVLQPMTRSVPLLDKAFAALSLRGDKRRCLDAVAEAASQLEAAAPERRKVILIIAQPSDVGSTAPLSDVLARMERDDITIYQLVMPLVGLDLMEKTVAITKINGVALGNGTGIMGSVDLSTLVPEIMRGKRTASGQDDLVILASDLGGIRIPFRKQRDLESGIGAIGRELHTGYVLTWRPDNDDPGYHRIRVEVTEPGMTVHARPGYYQQ